LLPKTKAKQVKPDKVSENNPYPWHHHHGYKPGQFAGFSSYLRAGGYMYHAGWGKQDLGIEPQGYAMHGFGQWQHRAHGQQSPLFARAFFLQELPAQDVKEKKSLIFCCVDLGYVTHAMRTGVCNTLQKHWRDDFNEAAFVFTCTHTHSGPGGCSHDALYNVATPGFVPEHLQKIISACVSAILQARKTAAPTDLDLTQGLFDPAIPVAWNRSLRAYNRNPDITPRTATETHLALNRSMQLLSFRRKGEVKSLLSLFGVHATCVGNSLRKHDGDNKGYAATQTEEILKAGGSADAVAIFAQATAGDVSPHYHGPDDAERRSRLSGNAEYAYAKRNGRHQSDRALLLAKENISEKISGPIDAIFSYVDFTTLKADASYANGEQNAYTSEPCHGVAFFAGTPVDGPGMPAPLAVIAEKISIAVKNYRLKRLKTYSPEEQAYYRRLYAAQGAKSILLEAGRKKILGQPLHKLMLPGFADPLIKELKRQTRIGAINKSAMVPTVLPLQIITIGQLALVCCPGEFTTIAGQRVIKTVEESLQARGIKHVLICTYCNDYMGYVTTNEEYQEQAYEGGHTIFGQWTLAAFQTQFAQLAQEILKPAEERRHDQTTRPAPAPADELAMRSNLRVPQ
jgi:neutral ceramidase